jgi:hypothetical protein
MAFSAEMLEKTFPVARSPRDKGYITDVRIYWNDVGTVLSLNGVPLTGGPADPKNTAEAMDTFERLIARAST